MKERRDFIKKAIIGSGVLASNKLMGQSCNFVQTPAQTEGPFYPDFDIKESDADLILMKGKNKRAYGKVVVVHGIIRDQYCHPVRGAIVEAWQACHSGKYNHRSDPNPAKLDPNFQYYAKIRTNDKGRFKIRTIIPGAYPATKDWIRPPHIHFKVSLRGYEELTTQMYFKGHPLNRKDRILLSLSSEEQRNVVVNFKPVKKNRGIPYMAGLFSINLRKY